MLVELTMRRTPPHRPDGSPAEGIRILALLPARWRKNLLNATGDVVIRIHSENEDSAEIRAAVSQALTDPAVLGWSLVDCAVLQNLG